MAKLNPIFGKATGKVGGSVFQINGGVQIWKEKPVKVSNPNTDAQAEQRAKLKLMSQLAADLQQTIAFQKKGLVSARNQFISANIGKCTFANNKADIELFKLDFTGGSVVLGNITTNAGGAVALDAAAPASVNSVLYACYILGDDHQLQLTDQKIVSVAGAGNTFPTTLSVPAGPYIVWAYGILNNGKASILSYEDYTAAFGNDDAFLSYVRSVVLKGGSLTATACASELGQ